MGLDLLQQRIEAGRYERLERYLEMARSGASRAASLTQRLLAFSRRQTLAPTAVDINQLVDGMGDILRRTLGPSIQTHFQLAHPLWRVLVDAPQLENALLNLCINARDAMPEGGQLIIQTHNLELDEEAAAPLELAPGPYVRLGVQDTGTGMSAEVMERVFEPFFTTKPIGQGTGLGLSMIYGFMRQSGGQVRMASRLGHGTTMQLLLPRLAGAEDAATADSAEPPALDPYARGEVLLVEDEAPVRALIAEALAEVGCRVTAVADGHAALEYLRGDAPIDLLLTDVGLPGGLNGRQVADAGRQLRPGLRVLFITGYAANAAVGAGQLDAGMEVMTKPFQAAELARRVQAILAPRG
jgi:CheY-like chemotaxis protein